MEGTVNWASRDEGRPALTIGAASLAVADKGAAATGPAFDGSADFVAVLAAGFADALPALTTGLTAFLATLTATLALALTAGLPLAAALPVAAGLAALVLDTGLTAVFLLAIGLDFFSAALPAADLATGLALTTTLALAAGLAAPLLADLLLSFTGLALEDTDTFPDLVFTSGLLAGLACA